MVVDVEFIVEFEIELVLFDVVEFEDVEFVFVDVVFVLLVVLFVDYKFLYCKVNKN